MKALKLLIPLLLLGLVWSCVKKKYPKPLEEINSAVYFSKFTVNNKPMVLEAGVDGYYMYSSYKPDSNMVYGFVADLKKPGCSTCSALRIQINDYKIATGGKHSPIDSALRSKNYPFRAGDPAATYKMQFFAIPDNTITYLWDFGDGTSSTEPNPVKIYSKADVYNVCLTTTSSSSYQSSICRKEVVPGSNQFKALITSIPGIGNAISFKSNVTGGKGSYKYLWNFGDGTSSTDKDPICNYKYRGGYTVSLRVIDDNDTTYASSNVKTASDNSSSVANYTSSDITTIAPPPALSQVIIAWTDEDGTVYTSNSTQQPSVSSFEILSVSDNERNENGQQTKKLTVKFACKLFNGSKSISIDAPEVVICVAYQ